MKLGEYVKFQNGYAFKSKDFIKTGKYKVIKIKEIKDGIVKIFPDTASIDCEVQNSFDKYLIYKGDVLFALTGDPVNKSNPLSWVGRVAIYTEDKPALLNQRVCKLITDENVNAKYVYYFFRQFNNFYNLASKATGSASQANISTKLIGDVDIDLPERSVQDEVVQWLDTISDKIMLNQKINDNLEQQAQLIFQSWFVDFEPFGGIMPSDWKVVPLDMIVDFQNGYAFKSKELLGESAPNTYRVFKQGHINRGGGFNPNGTKSWYPKEYAIHLEKYLLHKGDILMAMTDMKDNVAILGNTAIMPVENKYILNQRVGLLRANGTNGITYPYIYLLTNSNDFLTDLRGRANSGVQVNLSSTEIKASKAVLAPKKINVKFSNIVMPMIETILQNQLESEKLARLRDTLLPKLMSGKIDVSAIDI